MKFSIVCQRAFVGNDIDLQIDAEAEEVIVGVTCSLDGTDVASDDLTDAPAIFYHRSFSQVGEAQPGQVHKLVVAVRGKDGDPIRFATRIWTDPAS